MILDKIKELFGKYFLNYEEKLRTPFKLALFFFEFSVWIYLIFYLTASSEFQVTKACVEYDPLFQGLKNGSLVVMSRGRMDEIMGKLPFEPINITGLELRPINGSGVKETVEPIPI